MMNKIYQASNNSHRSGVGQANGGNNNTTRVGPQNAVATAPPPAQSINVPSANHSQQQQQQQHHQHHHHHHPRQHGQNPHPHHHQPPPQQPQQQQHQPQQQQQQQQQQHHHHPPPPQPLPPQPQQQQHHHHPQTQQLHQPQQQQHHHRHNPQLQPQNPAFVPHPAGNLAHEMPEHKHHHPQHPQVAHQALQQGPGLPLAPLPNQGQPQPNPQHNPIVKHHPPPAQQPPIATPQIHQHQPHHQHHLHPHPINHNQQQQQQQHHQPMHQPQIPISPTIPPQQWLGGSHPPTQAQPLPGQHHHPQNAQHPQQPQHQLPPHIAHSSNPPMMINQQYPNLFYTQVGHGFVPPPGHVSQYDHSPVASHQPDSGVNINSQQPVSINNHHPGNLPLTTQMQTVISTTTTGTTNIHHVNNGPIMEPHLSNRMPQQTYMIPGPYLQNPFNLMVSYPLPNLNTYPGGPIPPPSPAIIPPMRVPGDLERQNFNPQNQTTQLPTPATLSQPSVVKPPLPNVAPTITPLAPKPREKKALAIVHPETKHVFTVDELKGSPTTPQVQTNSKDQQLNPPTPRISDEDSTSKEEPIEGDATKASNATTKPIEKPIESPKSSEDKDLHEIELNDTEKPVSSNKVEAPQDACEKKTEENGETESKKEKDNDDLIEENIAGLTISDTGKSGEESKSPSNEPDTLTSTQAQSNLPYAAGQFSPMNPNGRRKYSIEFLRAVFKEMKLDPGTNSGPNHRIDFVPHYVNQGNNFREFASSQPLARRSNQQAIGKPRRVIVAPALPQEVELKTAEKPWKPELGDEKSKIDEAGQMDTKRLLKVFRGHLNKLTPQKYESLIEKIEALDLEGEDRLNSVIDLVFDKAVDEPGFCELYARMCKVIAAKQIQFSHQLLRKCQDEFEKTDLYDGLDVDKRKINIEEEHDITKKKIMYEELYEDMRRRRKKYLGTIKLIGEMYKLDLLLPKIIGLCMQYLLSVASNENFECLCSLISTVGFKMDREADKEIKDGFHNTLNVLRELANSKKMSNAFELESRIKFKILDTIELSRRGWRPRMVENNPKTIEEIREEAKEDMLRQQHHSHSGQGKNSLKSDDRDRDRARKTGHQYSAYSRGPNTKW